MFVERLGDRGGKAVPIHRQRAAGRHLIGVGARMISEPSRRISACSRPTALLAASSERKELEQTSSAKPSVRWASVIRSRAHLVQHDAHAGIGDLPGGFRAGKARADDVHEAGGDLGVVMARRVSAFSALAHLLQGRRNP